jgi:superoxide reductase
MTKLHEVYKCNVCGNITGVLHTGVGELVCCNQPMVLQTVKTKDEGNEKHVPVVEKTDKGFKVKVGSVAHPMEEAHHIEWIELIANGRAYREYLKPGVPPEAEFCVRAKSVQVREYCNLHGLWQA